MALYRLFVLYLLLYCLGHFYACTHILNNFVLSDLTTVGNHDYDCAAISRHSSLQSILGDRSSMIRALRGAIHNKATLHKPYHLSLAAQSLGEKNLFLRYLATGALVALSVLSDKNARRVCIEKSSSYGCFDCASLYAVLTFNLSILLL